MGHLPSFLETATASERESRDPVNNLKRFVVYLTLLASLSCPAAWAQTEAVKVPFNQQAEGWVRTLDWAEVQISIQSYWDDKALARLRARVDDVAVEAKATRAKAETELAAVDRLLQALGDPAAEAEEPAKIMQLRAAYKAERDSIQTRFSQSGLVMARSEELQRTLTQLSQQERFSRLLNQVPLPIRPSVIAEATPQLLGYLGSLLEAPVVWWRSISAETDGYRLASHALAILLLAALLGWTVRHFIIKWFGRDKSIERPSYTRRVGGALAEGVSGGLVPALIFTGLYFRLTSDSAILTGLFRDLAEQFCIAAILVVTGWSLPRAVMASGHPGWRLIDVGEVEARQIQRRLLAVTLLFATDILLRVGFSNLTVSESFLSVYSLVFSGSEALGILWLTPGRLWVSAERSLIERDAKAGLGSRKIRVSLISFWRLVRRLVAAIATVAILAVVFGFAALGTRLVYNILASALVIALLILVRSLLREVIGFSTSSRFAQAKLGLLHGTRTLIKFWLRTALDLTLLFFGVVLLVATWGAPFDEVWFWIGKFMDGFTIGEVTISIGDILLAVVVFSVVLLLTRLGQRFLTDTLLPASRFDTGLSHSISGGLGYFGLFLAITLAVLVLGVDFTSVALIAGALSVGIGFGLQNIVNNFVSGIILLIERPVRVGDWVIIGPNEGTVKTINVRATEIETFQRASIIVPNSELLSTAVTNWTHKDRFGRVDVPVTVVSDCDPKRVEAILLEIAKAHERVIDWPESFVLFQKISGEGLTLEIKCFTADVFWQFVIASDLRFAIHKRLAEEGIALALPHRVIHQAAVDPTA